VTEIIINLHHLGEQVPRFVEQHSSFGLRRVEYSAEPELLGTGGGLKQAAWFFDDGEPFLVHNVDVLSSVDLGELLAVHKRTGALATLAVQERPTKRPLCFDAAHHLVGRRVAETQDVIVRAPTGATCLAGFCGIQAISPAIFPLISESGEFSLVDVYLRLASGGRQVLGYRADGAKWRDCGRIADLIPL
jgi:NDP-sugar pyrophosphorylase family protein